MNKLNYIKAKFPNSKRSYTYRTADEVKAGDSVLTDKGAKLTVTDETVDMTWVETYGAENVAIVKKYEEQKVDVDSLDDETRCKYCAYNSDCPKGVRCYGGEPVFPYCSENEPELWFDEEEYLKDLEESEE